MDDMNDDQFYHDFDMIKDPDLYYGDPQSTDDAMDMEDGEAHDPQNAAPTTEPDLDYLSKLPVELIIKVMAACPDFTTLWGLINASKHLASVFDENAVSIKTAVMCASYPANSPIRILMREIIDIRTGYHSFTTWPAVVCIATNAPDAEPLPLALSPAMARKFVQLAHKIHLLAHISLDRSLQCFIADDQAAKCWHPLHDIVHVGVDCGYHANSQRPPINLPRPDWLAEQRAVLSFWSIQYYLELQQARENYRLQFWPREAKQELYWSRVFDFYKGHRRQFFCTAADLIDVLMGEAPGTFVVNYSPFALPSLDEIIKAAHQHIYTHASEHVSVEFSASPSPSVSLECPTPTSVHQGAVCAQGTAGKYLMGLHEYEVPTLPGVPDLAIRRYIWLFRRYGVYYWDHNMLQAMGLLPPLLGQLQFDKELADIYFFKWRRFLTHHGH